MFKITYQFLIIICLLFACHRLSYPQQDEKNLSMSLRDCIIFSLENNLNLQIELLNPEISKLSVTRAKERFLPEFSFSFNKRKTENASYSWLEAENQVKTEYQAFSGQISQFFHTGGRLTVSLQSDENDTNQSFQTINPRYGSTLRFILNQPLLKNFGINTNKKDIIIARNNLNISKNRFKTTLMDTIYSVEEAYWNLVYSIENLEVKQQSLKLAIELLAKNRRSVEIGKLAPIEIKSAEAEVATRQADILQAEAMVKNAEDRLKFILNIESGENNINVKIIPTDKPQLEKKTMEILHAIELALENRPDLEERKIDFKNKEVEVRYSKNQLLPDLSLQASYWSPGISGDQLVYENDNPLTGVVVDTLDGNSSDATRDAFKFLYPNWSIALNLTIPLSSMTTRSQVALAKLNLRQSELQLFNKEQQILLDIKNALRAVQTNYLRVQAYRSARELTEKKLEAEEEKLKVGKSTNYNVFLFQRDLASAQSNELNSIIAYNLSLAYQDKVLGITLAQKNIKVKDIKIQK
jgi:outer membrane protein TolC